MNRPNVGVSIDRFSKNATIRTVVRPSVRPFVGFQLSIHPFARHTATTRRESSVDDLVETNLFVSFLLSSRSFLRRARRRSSELVYDDAVDVRDVANMPRCGNGSGDDDDDATRRCDDKKATMRPRGDGVDFLSSNARRGGWWRGIDDADDDVGWMTMTMCATVFFKLTRWFGCV